MTSALFGGSTRSGSSKHLVEFRAGKMYMKAQMVHPDKRKGQVYIYQADDSLMHFCWKDRTSGTVEEDLIVFPDDCEYKKVAACTTGRVFVLKFKSSNRKLFFWMQEPKTDKDEENVRKINDILNNPPTPGSNRSTGSTPNPVLGSDLSNLRDSDIQNLFGNISQQQLMQILGSGMSSLATLLGPQSGGQGGRSSSSTSATTTASTTPAATTTTTPTPAPTTPATVDLSSAMTAEALQPILTNQDFVDQLKPFLPATASELPPAEQLKGTVTSPQFQQAVSLLSSALQSGQLGPLINQFGLGEEAVLAATACDMEAFVKALGKKKDASSSSGSKEEDKKEPGKKDQDKDEDDSMSVD